MAESQTEYPHLTKAPIVEAVIDVRVNLPAEFKLDAFHPLRSQLSHDYPGFEEQQIIEQMIKQEPGRAAEVSTRLSGTHGHRLISQDGKNIVQFRRDGFTFSRLTPYATWEEAFAEFWRLWGMYLEAAKPIEIVRIAVRYINRMSFPLPFSNPEEYLKAPPVTAEGWPTEMSAFLSRVVMHEPTNDISINVIQALEPPMPGQTAVSVIFDIDAYQEVTLPPVDGTIPKRFARLRQMKNRVFFNGLTQKAIEQFQ